jgi:hypothetical protein
MFRENATKYIDGTHTIDSIRVRHMIVSRQASRHHTKTQHKYRICFLGCKYSVL